MIIRKARPEDIEAYYDISAKPTIKAWVAEINGKIVGCAGVVLSKGRWIGFCDLDQEARRITVARRVKRELQNLGCRYVYVMADPNEPRAERWLTSLGFSPDPRKGHPLYRWGD